MRILKSILCVHTQHNTGQRKKNIEPMLDPTAAVAVAAVCCRVTRRHVPDGGDEAGRERVVRETQQQAALADTCTRHAEPSEQSGHITREPRKPCTQAAGTVCGRRPLCTTPMVPPAPLLPLRRRRRRNTEHTTAVATTATRTTVTNEQELDQVVVRGFTARARRRRGSRHDDAEKRDDERTSARADYTRHQRTA